jgi:hypothetical protein
MQAKQEKRKKEEKVMRMKVQPEESNQLSIKINRLNTLNSMQFLIQFVLIHK